MPIYEFECEACGERFDQLAAVGTDSAECPACGASGAPRRFSSFAFSRQPTAAQRRRREDKRGVGRDGARERFKQRLSKARERGAAERRKRGG